MRRIWLTVLILTATLPAQHGAKPLPESKRPVVHRPRLGLLSVDALRELQLGAARAQNGIAEQEHESSRRKPPGMGRYLAALIVCADANLDLLKLFDQDVEDLLILSSPGPLLHAAEVSMIEHAVSEHHLSLCVVITHQHCETLGKLRPGNKEGWVERLQPSVTLAERRGISLEDAHGVIAAKLLLESSERLGKAQKAGKFQVASLLLRRQGKREPPELRWRATWSKRPFHSAASRPPR